jgi:hypothetical protein
MGHRAVFGALLAVAATVAFAACRSSDDGCGVNAGMASVVRFGGVLYTGSPLPEGRSVSVGAPVGDGSDACGREVTVRAIAGVPPAAAVVAVAPGETEANSVFLAPGFMPAMASHPLHAELFDVRRRWTTELRDRCRQATRLDGVVEPIDQIAQLQLPGRIVLIDGRTLYRGPRRAGLPYLEGGERLVVRGRACRGTRVVAQVIRVMR